MIKECRFMNTCDNIVYSRCVRYEGFISDISPLKGKCDISVHEALEDIYKTLKEPEGISYINGEGLNLDGREFSVAFGTTSTTAKRGDWTPYWEDVKNRPDIPKQINIVAGQNITLTGTYPNIVVNAKLDSIGEGKYEDITNDSDSNYYVWSPEVLNRWLLNKAYITFEDIGDVASKEWTIENFIDKTHVVFGITNYDISKWNESSNSKHNHNNKSVLDLTTQPFTTELKDKIDSLENYELPKATYNTLGGIIVGDNLQINQDGVLSSLSQTYQIFDRYLDGLVPKSGEGIDTRYLREDGVWAEVNADKNFVHEQTIPAKIWEFIHNLGKKPSVTITDSAGTVIEGSVVINDGVSIKVEFNFPFWGFAICN